MTLLGAPILKGPAVDKALDNKVADLERAMQRLSLLHAHDAMVLLKNSLSMPKLLYLLRTSECSGNVLLSKFDDTLRTGLCKLLNVELGDDQWLQASLPLRNGGLGIRSAKMLAPSAFLASAASTLSLQQSILPEPFKSSPDLTVATMLTHWKNLSGTEEPKPEDQQTQKAWDGMVARKHHETCLSRATTDVDKARLFAAAAPHSGDWLNAPPITAIGLRLDDEALRVAVVQRLGSRACEPHICPCSKLVDARGLHGLSCKLSGPRQQRHSQMNDIIWTAIKRAQIPATKEPIGLFRHDNKRPDGVTQIPWARGKPMAWDVTVPDTFAQSHIQNTSAEAGAAANHAAAAKTAKYLMLEDTHLFIPVAIETGGAWNVQAIELVQEIGQRISTVTMDSKETTYLFQRLSMTIQRGNAVSFRNTFQFE